MPSGRKSIRTRKPAAAHDRATAYARSHPSLRASGMMATSCTRLFFSCSVCPSSHRPSPPTLEVAGIEPPNVFHKRSTHALLSTTMTGFRFSQGAAPSTLSKRYSRGSTPCIEPCEPAGADEVVRVRGDHLGERWYRSCRSDGVVSPAYPAPVGLSLRHRARCAATGAQVRRLVRGSRRAAPWRGESRPGTWVVPEAERALVGSARRPISAAEADHPITAGHLRKDACLRGSCSRSPI